mgnify:FL=1
MTFIVNAPFQPLPDLREVQQNNWDQQRQHLSDSEFYRRYHPAAPFSFPLDLDDIAELPLTDKDMLRTDQSVHPPFGSYLGFPSNRVVRLHRTSGTSGHAMNIALSSADALMQAHIAGRSQSAAGLGPGDIVVHCLNYQLWMGGLTDHLGLESTGALVVPFGSGGSELLIRTILDVGINAISCTPSYPARLEQVITERFPELTPRDLGLRKGFMGGEAGLDDPTFRQRLETVWGMQAMNANYGVSDFLCNFAGQCTDQADLHFLALDVALPELVNVNTSEPQPWRAGTEGELVLTNLSKDCQSLVRFRTGDLVRLTSTDMCQCGRTAPRFRVIGRTDEMIVVRGVNTYPSGVSAAVLSCPELNGEYRIRLTHKGPYDRLPLEVELNNSAHPSDHLLARLSHHIGQVLRLTVELKLLAPGNLPRSEGKTKRVIKEYLS